MTLRFYLRFDRRFETMERREKLVVLRNVEHDSRFVEGRHKALRYGDRARVGVAGESHVEIDLTE